MLRWNSAFSGRRLPCPAVRGDGLQPLNPCQIRIGLGVRSVKGGGDAPRSPGGVVVTDTCKRNVLFETQRESCVVNERPQEVLAALNPASMTGSSRGELFDSRRSEVCERIRQTIQRCPFLTQEAANRAHTSMRNDVVPLNFRCRFHPPSAVHQTRRSLRILQLIHRRVF